MLSIESGTDAASGLAIAILDDAKILIPLNQRVKTTAYIAVRCH